MSKHLHPASGKYNKLVPQTNSHYLTFHQGAIESYWFELDKNVVCNETESVAIYYRQEMSLKGVCEFLEHAVKILKSHDKSESPKKSIPDFPDSVNEADCFGSEIESIDLDESNYLDAPNDQPAKTISIDTNDLNFSPGTRHSKTESSLCSLLAQSGYAVYRLKEGGYLVCKHGCIQNEIDLVGLKALADCLGERLE